MKEIFRLRCPPATRQSTDYSLSAPNRSEDTCSCLPCLGVSLSTGKLYKKGGIGVVWEHRSWMCCLTRGTILPVHLHLLEITCFPIAMKTQEFDFRPSNKVGNASIKLWVLQQEESKGIPVLLTQQLLLRNREKWEILKETVLSL